MFAEQQARKWSGTHVVLLGTAGGPVPTVGRSMTSQAVVVDGDAYLVDCGSGVLRQLVDAGIPPYSLKALFVSHLHGDHVNDYFSTVTLAQQPGKQETRAEPLAVYGPGPGGGESTTGIEDLNARILEAYETTLNIHYPALRELIVARDIEIPEVGAGPNGPHAPPMDPFLVHADDRVRVMAILVNHRVFPTFAFRFETDDGVVVFSSDTTPTPNLVTLARGADILVHEVMHAQAMIDSGTSEKFVRFLLTLHTDVTQLGQIAHSAGVKHLVLSHIIPLNLATPYPPTIPEDDWIAPIREHFGGRITMGADLMRFPVGATRAT